MIEQQFLKIFIKKMKVLANCVLLEEMEITMDLLVKLISDEKAMAEDQEQLIKGFVMTVPSRLVTMI